MKLLYIFLSAVTIGCSGCSPTNVDVTSNNDDSSYEEPAEESPITWTECGYQVGDNPCDFSLVDVNGDTFNLYDHYGEVLLLDFSTMWCYYCQVAASLVQGMQDQYSQDGFSYVTILIEDSYGGTVEQSDLVEWADEFGITTAPLLAGSRDLVDLTAEEGYPITGWPTFVLINREMVLTKGLNGWSEEIITGWVEDAME